MQFLDLEKTSTASISTALHKYCKPMLVHTVSIAIAQCTHFSHCSCSCSQLASTLKLTKMSITRTSTRLYTAMANLNHPIRSQPTGTNDITAPYQAQCWPSVKRLPTMHTIIFSLQRTITTQVHQVLKWCKWNHWCWRLGNLCSIGQRPPPAFLQAINFFFF